MKKSITLDRLPIGHGGVLETIGGTGALRCRLLDMGLIPGTHVTLIKVAPKSPCARSHRWAIPSSCSCAGTS